MLIQNIGGYQKRQCEARDGGIGMVIDKFRCEKCSRGCSITLAKLNEVHYIYGNTCRVGGENAIKHWQLTGDQEVIMGKPNPKKGLFSNLFNGKNLFKFGSIR